MVIRNSIAVSWRHCHIRGSVRRINLFAPSCKLLISRDFHSDPQIAELRQMVPTRELVRDITMNFISNPHVLDAQVFVRAYVNY